MLRRLVALGVAVASLSVSACSQHVGTSAQLSNDTRSGNMVFQGTSPDAAQTGTLWQFEPLSQATDTFAYMYAVGGESESPSGFDRAYVWRNQTQVGFSDAAGNITTLTVPTSFSGGHTASAVRGAVFDAALNRIYVSLVFGDTGVAYSTLSNGSWTFVPLTQRPVGPIVEVDSKYIYVLTVSNSSTKVYVTGVDSAGNQTGEVALPTTGPFSMCAANKNSGGTVFLGDSSTKEILKVDDNVNPPTVTAYLTTGYPGDCDVLSNGNLYATEQFSTNNNDIIQLTPTGGVTEYRDPLGSYSDSGMTHTGQTVWYTNGAGDLVQVNTVSKVFQHHPYPSSFKYHYFVGQTVVAGTDGNIYLGGDIAQNGIGLFNRYRISVSPSSLAFSGIGQQLNITVSEKIYKGTWTAISSNTSVVQVGALSGSTFPVTATGHGNAHVTVYDFDQMNSLTVSATVP